VADTPITTLSICSGAGGLDLGVRMAVRGARTVCYVEREAAAIAVLAARMADGRLDSAPVWTDLRTFEGAAWRGVVDLIAAGIPCQPHSLAGLRRGAADERDLWPDLRRVIGECRPATVFLENVPGILPYYWGTIRPQLQDLGYRTAETLASAEAAGAPHRRERFFALAWRPCERWDAIRRAVADGNRARPPSPGPHEVSFAEQDSGALAGRTVADPDGERGCGRSSGSQNAADAHPAGEGLGVFPPGPTSNRWADILEQYPTLAPAVESPLRGVADGLAAGVDLSDSLRLKLIGNGVVPQQVAMAIRALVQSALRQ
jgi:DNA (cytosine-5)-methyltransferase 1